MGVSTFDKLYITDPIMNVMLLQKLNSGLRRKNTNHKEKVVRAEHF